MNVLSTRVFGQVCASCSGSETDVGPVAEVIFATCKVASGRVELSGPLYASLNLRALFGNSSLSHSGSGHLFPWVRLGASISTEELHVSRLESLIAGLFVSEGVLSLIHI